MNALLAGIWAAYLLGAVGSWIFRKSRALSLLVGQGSAVMAAVAGIGLSGSVLWLGERAALTLPSGLPLLEIRFVVDPLSAFFILLISLTSLAVSIYSLGYLRPYGDHDSLGLFGALYHLFLLSLVAVVSASNGFLFLILWESMSLVSFLLVNYEHDPPETRKAAFTYLFMTHVGTAFISVAFLLCFSAWGTFDFEALRAASHGFSENLKGAIFLCGLIGFGTKAGLIPLHIWLPAAHPAAPSNVSALMSGVMIKMGIYGILRFCFWVLGPGPSWWGSLVLLLGVLSAVLGVMYALMEHDIKRLLAFSSIENIGIILIGIGIAMVFLSHGLPELSALALAAALYHTLNHALFKALLFLGAGAAVSATGTRNMEEMGGLIHRMPYTAFFFLIGAVSISALPPLNGFVSEWLTFQSLLLSFHLPNTMEQVLFPMAGGLLALTGALAAACFVKAFGITFLAIPRSRRAAEAREGGWSMRLGMGILALLCAVLGLFPGAMIRLVDRVVFPLVPVHVGERLLKGGGTLVPVYDRFSSLSAGWLAVGIALGAAGALGVALWIGGRRHSRVGETWACGIPQLTPRMEYTATGYSKSIQMIFQSIYRPREEISIRRREGQPYVAVETTYRAEIVHVAEKYLYGPLLRGVERLGEGVKVFQSGSIHAYLAYIFVTLLAGLFVLTILL